MKQDITVDSNGHLYTLDNKNSYRKDCSFSVIEDGALLTLFVSESHAFSVLRHLSVISELRLDYVNIL